jgi:hypothetical protein
MASPIPDDAPVTQTTFHEFHENDIPKIKLLLTWEGLYFIFEEFFGDSLPHNIMQ